MSSEKSDVTDGLGQRPGQQVDDDRIDMVPRALAAARRRAAAAGVSPRYVCGDVTRLQELGIGDDFSLVLDFGCFHTLPEDRLGPHVESVSGVAAKGWVLVEADRTAPGTLDASGRRVDERFELWRCRLRHLA